MTQQLHVQAWNPEERQAQPRPWQRGSRPSEGGLKPHALAITGEAEQGADGGGVRQQGDRGSGCARTGLHDRVSEQAASTDPQVPCVKGPRQENPQRQGPRGRGAGTEPAVGVMSGSDKG